MSDSKQIFNADRSDAFTALCLDYLDGRLAPDAADAFKAQLKADPDKRQAFVLLMYRTQLLAEANAAADAQPVDTESKPRGAAQRTPGIPRTTRKRSFRIAPILYTLAALLAVAAYSAVVYFHNADPSDIEHRPSDIEQPPLATLIESTPGSNLTTPGGFIADGRDYPSGEYTLDSGKAEFMLTNAVNVKLRGDTRMTMRNDMNVSLTRGSAAFVCPTDAKGFTVALPHGMKIVDLGTAFTVRLDDQGAARVAVTEGEVDLVTSDGQANRMVAGDFAESDASGQLDTESSWFASSGKPRPSGLAMFTFDSNIQAAIRDDFESITVGSLIEVGDAPITITHLGVHDVPDANSGRPDGFITSESIRVGLWDAAGRTLLAEVAVGGDALLIDSYRYAEFSDGPIALEANTRYLIGAQVGSSIEPFVDGSGRSGSKLAPPFSASPSIRAIESRHIDAPFAAPTTRGQLSPLRWAPANAMFAQPPIESNKPEKATDQSQEESLIPLSKGDPQ